MKSIARNPLLGQMLSFGLIGCINAAVDTAVFFMALAWVTSSLVAANSCAWVTAVTCSYLLNSQITFRERSGGKLRLRDYLKFVATQFGGFLANTAVVVAAAPYMPLLAAKAFAIGAGFVVNFTLARMVVFR